MTKVLHLSQKGLDLIKQFEGLKLKPYLCPANIATVGFGNTYYPDGTKVKLTDPAITAQKAEELLKFLVQSYEKGVDSFCRDDINQNQFDALTSFAYNVGVGNLQKSTLIKKVNLNPNDPAIRLEFMKWNKGAGKVLAGLTRRRQAEADLYFS
jgi:lysozyme